MPPSAGQLLEEVHSLKGTVSELKTENEILRLKIRALELAQARPVKGGEDPNQLPLEIQSTESISVEREPGDEPAKDDTASRSLPSSTTKRRSKKRIRGAEKFEKIPVKKTTVLIPHEVEAKPDQWKEIGEEVTYEVIVEPAKLYRHRIVRKKYCNVIDRSASPIMPKAPARFCSDYASTSLAVHIAIGKYLDHGSLNRLQQQFARMGADIPRQTQSDIIERLSVWMRPLYELLGKHIDQSGYIQVDETFIRYINGRLSGSGQGYFWAKNAPTLAAVYKWIPNRRHENVATLVENFSGILQSDGYAAYSNYAKTRDDIRLAACWSHTFRKFRDALNEEPSLARQAMTTISKLYDLEEAWNRDGVDAPQRKALRSEKSLPLATAFKADLDTWLADSSLLNGSFRTAVAYALSQWKGLLECLRHGHTFLDTNLLESKFRPTKIGERNWSFIGHPEAGEKSAIIYSILATCRIHKTEPRAYLQAVLDQLVQYGPEPSPTQLEPLLPWNWIAANPEAFVKEPAAY
jgi:transposase